MMKLRERHILRDKVQEQMRNKAEMAIKVPMTSGTSHLAQIRVKTADRHFPSWRREFLK
jgi:hypothetical protein